jgi:hypothetical protein
MSQINGTAANEKTSWLMRLAQSHPRDLVCLISSTQALDYDLLERFEDKWDWIGVSCNTACPWSIELIQRFKDRFHWEGIFDGGLTGNARLPWSEGLIETFKDYWDWRRIECELELGDRLMFGTAYDHCATGELSRSEALPWTDELISRYVDRWDWEILSSNRSLPWSRALVKRFEEHWHWGRLSSNDRLPWSSAFVLEFGHRWDWTILLREQQVVWSPGHVEYIRKCALAFFSGRDDFDTSVVPLSVDIVDRHFRDDPWGRNDFACSATLPWSVELIRRHADYWDWVTLSANPLLPWSTDLIDEFAELWCWDHLSSNPGLPWSDEFVIRHEDRWCWEALSNNAAVRGFALTNERYGSQLRPMAAVRSPSLTRRITNRRGTGGREQPVLDFFRSRPVLSRDEIIEAMDNVDLSEATNSLDNENPFG